ncbi:MAG: T9SS type A sorting domain-containing protein [Bacteroidales bacterium]|nr:T9SS type A sorting domain-containing protein [Bacteroidales bacterium]
MSIFPIPATDQFTISSKVEISLLEIMNIAGVTVKTITNVGSTVDVSNLATGIYLVKATTGRGETGFSRIAIK